MAGEEAYLEGVAIDDPDGRLEGTGNQVRSIRVDERAAILDDAYIRRLMAQALRLAGADLKTGRGEVVLKSKITTQQRRSMAVHRPRMGRVR